MRRELTALLGSQPIRWRSVEFGVFIVDVLVFVAFIVLALRANRFWPIWVSALLGLGVLGHLARWAGPDVIPWAYAVVLTIWSYPILAIIALGTFNHQRRLKRFGSDASWSSSSVRSPTPPACADALIAEFGSVAGMLAAGTGAQARVLGANHPAIAHFSMIREVMLHVLRAEAAKAPILGSSQALIDYLFADLAHLPTERLRVLFLNAKNRLLRDELISEGSVSETPIYPREIMRRGLELGATALILAHNHPVRRPGRRAKATSRPHAASSRRGARSTSESMTM